MGAFKDIYRRWVEAVNDRNALQGALASMEAELAAMKERAEKEEAAAAKLRKRMDKDRKQASEVAGEMVMQRNQVAANELAEVRNQAQARLDKALGLLREVSDPDKQFWIIGEEAEDYRVRIRDFLAGWVREEREPAQPLVEFPPEPEAEEFLQTGASLFSTCGRYQIWKNGKYFWAPSGCRDIDSHDTYALAVAACNEHAKAAQKGAGA